MCFQTFRNAWKVAEIRKKILYTLLILFIFRLGCNIPVPFLDAEALKSMMGEGGTVLSMLDLMSAVRFQREHYLHCQFSPILTHRLSFSF
jgi:preprotein translocase subunit SecY